METSERFLDPGRIEDLRVAGDMRVTGMDHLYYTKGLGVPLVAHRLAVAQPSSSDSPDRFLPRELQTGTTAVIMPGGGLAGGQWRLTPAALVLFDPFVEQSLGIGANRVELASDRTTPLAAQVARGHLATLEWLGLFESDFKRPGYEGGLYMMRPYEPGKIPVVFVHGLFSSPRAWMQTINELRNSPELDARFQYWVFLYPTGLPIPSSAARLRDSLVDVRESLDPAHRDLALDRMVLIGHSMGGILSKMMAQDTGYQLWNAAITVPHDQFKASPELKTSLDHALVFHPLPFVRRVVFVATPHRGSPIADSLFGRAISDLVRRPVSLASRIREIEKLNGPHVISREAAQPAAQRDRQPADRQSDPGGPGPHLGQPGGSLSLDHSLDRRPERGHRRRGRISQLASGRGRFRADRGGHACLARRPASDPRAAPHLPRASRVGRASRRADGGCRRA